MDQWLLKSGHQNCITVPDHFFEKCGSLAFVLRCNYNAKYSENIFYYFSKLKALYNRDSMRNRIPFKNNIDILIDIKPFLIGNDSPKA